MSVARREVQVQAARRCHLSSVRIANMGRTDKSLGKNVEGENEPSHTAGWNVNRCSRYGKHYGRSSETYDTRVYIYWLYGIYNEVCCMFWYYL